MPRKSAKRTAPYDPAAKARQDAELRINPSKWGANAAALGLPANAAVQSEAATRERVARHQRYDVFHLLHARGGLGHAELTSARQLQDEMAARYGLDGETSEIKGGGGSIELITARKIEAGAKVDALLEWCGRPFASLLVGLCEPMAYGSVPNWRKIVEAQLGEHRHVQQAECVKSACQALTASFARWDAGERPPKRERHPLEVAA